MRVFVTSIPKSGTHLLVDIIKRTHNCYSFGFSKHHALALRQYGRNQLLDVLTGFGDGVALYGHFRLGDWEDLADCLSRLRYRIIVLIRDPADVAISLRDYYLASLDQGLLPAKKFLATLDEREQFERIMLGFRVDTLDMQGIVQHCSGFCDWMARPNVSLLRYEDLTADSLTDATLAAVAEGGIADASAATAILSSRGKSTPTFNIGVVGRGRTIGPLSADSMAALKTARLSLGYPFEADDVVSGNAG